MNGVLTLRRDPVRLLLSRGLWAGTWYLLAYQVTGWVLFTIALSVTLTGAVLCVTLAGIPLLIGAAAAIRWCADVERARLLPFCGDVGSHYRQQAASGMLSRVRVLWRDPAIWRDIAYLLGMLVPLVTLDLIVLTVWLVLLAGITLPAWYWAPWQTVHGVRFHGAQLGYFPDGPHGHLAYGLYIDTLPKALLAAAAFAIAFLLFNYVLVATARAHVAVARHLLGAPEDPLRAAREVLGRPGPLSAAESAAHPGRTEEFIPNER
ncbi:MAG TPA: sensor domain-containing protein [Trebonia sp.]